MSRGMGMSLTEWLREQMVSAEVMTRRGCFPFFFGEMTKGLAGRFRDALLAYGEIEGGLLLSRF